MKRKRTKFYGTPPNQDGHQDDHLQRYLSHLPSTYDPISYTHLPPEDIMFVHELILDNKPGMALIRSGQVPSTQEEKAYSMAIEKLQNSDLLDLYNKMVRDRIRRTMATSDRIVGEFSKLAFSNPHQLFDDKWNLKKKDEVPPDLLAAISSVDRTVDVTETEMPDGRVKTNKRYRTKVKTISKLDALKQLSNYLNPENVKSVLPPTTQIHIDQMNVQNNKVQERIENLNDDEIRLLAKVVGVEDDICHLEQIQDAVINGGEANGL